MKITIAGCGDAFGSGGRFNTCFHVESGDTRFLIDCGASSLVALRKLGIDPAAIDRIYISHLHGDHFGGLPFYLIDALYLSQRTKPLTLIGPEGLEERLHIATEAMFTGTMDAPRQFDLRYEVYAEATPLQLGEIEVTPYEVVHFCGAPPYALRFQLEDKVLAFSGDTRWVDVLRAVGRDADLFLCECYLFDQPSTMHLNYMEIRDHLFSIGAKRILLTHMGEDMIRHSPDVDLTHAEIAEDGMVIEL